MRGTTVKPAELDSLCSSLSSLQWLAALRCDSGLKKAILSPTKLSPPSSPASGRKGLGAIQEESVEEEDNVDWSVSACKPPYAYASLIYMALKSSNQDKLALSEIYEYITTNYAYYRTADSGWKNSVRHNLSSSKCFEKVTRSDTEKGKGGFWCLAPNHEEMAHLVLRKKRRRNKKRTTSGKSKGSSPLTKRRSPSASPSVSPTTRKASYAAAFAAVGLAGDKGEGIAESLDLFEGLDWHSALGDSMNTAYLMPEMHCSPSPLAGSPLRNGRSAEGTRGFGSTTLLDVSSSDGTAVSRWEEGKSPEASKDPLSLVGRKCVMHEIPMDLTHSLTGDLLLSGSEDLSQSTRAILHETADHGPLCFMPSAGDSFNGASPVPMEGLVRDTNMLSPCPEFEVNDELGGTMVGDSEQPIPADWLA